MNKTKKNASQAATQPAQSGIINADLALDLGNGIVNAEGDEISFDERAILAPLSDASAIGGLPMESVFQFRGRWWVLGEMCYTLAPSAIEDRVMDDRYTDDWYKTLLVGALHRAFHSRAAQNAVIAPRILSSIPAMLYKDKVIAEQVRAHLAGVYDIGNILNGTLRVDATKIMIIPEGIGSHWMNIYGGGSNEARYTSGVWMYCDQGFMSLDSVKVKDGAYQPTEARSDTMTGAVSVAQEVADFVRRETGVTLHQSEVDQLMRCDTFEVNDTPLNVVEVREAAYVMLAERATNLIEGWARGQNLKGVILTGGGAEKLHRYFNSKRLPRPILQPHAPRANVEGAYMHLKHI